MKTHLPSVSILKSNAFRALTVLSTLIPATSQAATADNPIQMNVASYMLIAFLLVFSIVMFFIFQRRFNMTKRELQDIACELDTTRERLTDTSKDLEQTQKELKATTNRYQGILFEAEVGMFQVDTKGKCTYVNNALQEMSGLYQKKAFTEGLASAVHPDDRATFEESWNAFVESDKPFNQTFRFQYKRGREVREFHAHCRANKVLNLKKDVESYIGWVTDVSHFHQQHINEKARTARYNHFVHETIEGFFRLTPQTPIPVSSSPAKMAEAILEHMVMTDCNDTFAAMYGASTKELNGKSMNDLQGGCGPFKNKQDMIRFVEDGYKAVNVESVKQDPSGSRLSLVNNIVGIIEDNMLVGIWGAQRNVSHQKREKAELNNQVRFMHRILNALPADVHVKDTRCRYLYASKKLADRTGISQEEWIGKTIFEVMPATTRDHDQQAVETMKSGKLNRTERPFEARGKSGWMETVQIPLVSDEGLVEGVVGLSLDITDRKSREQVARQKQTELENHLKQVRNDLSQSRAEYAKTATTLSETIQKLNVVEAEMTNREHAFNEKLAERKRVEEGLRKNEESLKARQRQLETTLSERLKELKEETNKRKKWEDLLAIRQEELHKLEVLSKELEQQLAETEDFLQSTQEQLIRITEQHAAEMEKESNAHKAVSEQLALVQKDLEGSDSRWKQQIETANAEQQKQLEEEHKTRVAVEKQLAKAESQLQLIHTEIKEQAERHSRELEEEVAERKAAAEKLIQSMEELDELRQQFNGRIEEETRTIKQELAQKQIREKTLRQNEKDLEERIKELESTLQMKSKEFAEQIQAREGAEVQKQQIEQRLEQLTKRQQELVARETQKLQLHIAEIRLEEVKLRKEAGDLQRDKEVLEEQLHQLNGELEKVTTHQQGTEAMLNETKSQLKKLSDNQDQLIAAETESLRQQLLEVKQHGEELQKQLKQLEQGKQELETSLSARNTELETADKKYQEANKLLADTEAKLKKLTDSQSDMLKSETEDLRKQIEQIQAGSNKLQEQLEEVRNEKQNVEKDLESRTQDLGRAAREYRKVVDAYKGTQTKLKQLSETHEATLAQKTKELNVELDKLKKTESQLLAKGEKLEAHIVEQKQKITELSAKLEEEATKRQQADKELKDLQTAVESDRENADALMQEQTKALRNKLEQSGKNEDALKLELEQSRKDITERDEALANMKTEREQTEARIQEVEKRLTGIREEHQAELKKSMAEVKQISRLNSELVDELNDTLQTALNPVVKTTILLEKCDNLSQDQKQELARANTSCRKLIDTMNYRCELTHIADGSDKVESSKCDLHGLMTDVDQQFSHRAETKKLFFAVSFAQYQAAHNVPKYVETDELKIRKVLSILLGYAIEKTEKGRLGLHATRKSNSDNTANIAFELAYTGKEANDALLNAIFGEEQDGEETVDVKYGLTLARHYVGMLNGEFALEYRSGGLTVLTLQFPFAKVGSDAAAAADDDKKAGAA